MFTTNRFQIEACPWNVDGRIMAPEPRFLAGKTGFAVFVVVLRTVLGFKYLSIALKATAFVHRWLVD